MLALLALFNPVGALAKGNASRVIVENGTPKIVINDRVVNNMFGIDVYSAHMDPSTPELLAGMKDVIDRASNMGIPIINFQVLWNDYDRSTTAPKSVEEAVARFHTKNLDALLDYASGKKVYVLLDLLSHAHWALPAWWKELGDNGNAYQIIGPPGEQIDAYNRTQTPVASYQSPTHRELLKGLLTMLVTRYKNHPAIMGWGINPGPTGENGYAPNYLDLMLNASLTSSLDFRLAMADYSSIALSSFRRWLEDKYISIDLLNEAWGVQYTSFEQAQPPYPKKISLQETFENNGDSRSSMLDWQAFRYEALLDEWKFMSDTVRSLDSTKILTGKTSWCPIMLQSGSEAMLATAVSVFDDHLIDADKLCGGITINDKNPGARIDLANLSKFSRKYKAVRIYNFENWVKADRTLPIGTRIAPDLAMAVKEVMKREGGYMWFTVALGGDTHPKPDWSWEEIQSLVSQCRADELSDARADSPPILFFYDVDNLMPHYYDSSPKLKTSHLYAAISKALYRDSEQPEYGFIDAEDIEEGALDLALPKLIIMANQRVLSASLVTRLQKYMASGGAVLLVGSNGVFDESGQRNTFSISRLAPRLTADQVQSLYNWGMKQNILIPFVVISSTNESFFQIPLDGEESGNYGLLRSALVSLVPLAQTGELSFSGSIANVPFPVSSNQKIAPVPVAAKSPPAKTGVKPQGERNLIKDFDRNNDGIVSRNEFPGPSEMFNRLDANQDGAIDAGEAKRDQNGRMEASPGHRPPPGGLDANHDGVISRDEFPGPSEVFDSLDADHDGAIDAGEAKRNQSGGGNPLPGK
jgi:hypothetical protein